EGRSAPWRLFVAVAMMLLSSLIARAVGADEPKKTRIVLYLETPGVTTPPTAAHIRGALPENFAVVETTVFDAAMIAHGQQGSYSRALGEDAKRTALFSRMRKSAAAIQADGVVYIFVRQSARRRSAHVAVLAAGEETPTFYELLPLKGATA